MDALRFNKIAAALLSGVLLIMVFGKIGNLLVNPKTEVSNAYPIEVPEKAETKSKETKEHVTPKIIKSKKYKKYNFQLTNDYSKYNLSVDYRKDLNFVKKVYNLYGEFNFSITKLIKIVKQLH